MAKTAVVTTRIEPELKAEVEAVLTDLGLTTSQAIALYFKQIAMNKGLPFLVQIPNRETRAAIAEAQRPENLLAFNNLDELFEELEI